MTVKKLKQINNKEISHILKKFVSSSSNRPVLTYAHLENEFVYATDSHQLIRIKKSIIEGFSDNNGSTFYNPRNTQFEEVAGQLILKGINRSNREEVTTFYPTGIHADNVSIYVNAAFLLNAITSIKKGLSITRDKEINVQYQGTLRPLYMTLPNEEMSALILPIRV